MFNGSCDFMPWQIMVVKQGLLPLGESHTTETLLRRNEGTQHQAMIVNNNSVTTGQNLARQN